ncbi:MAG: FKBP-type peptidyl-prolyl cis-trans isomerase [Bacteroidota bacterium]|nr:FKBP-type peptidyl-prolyl cis-trans isomerase [Bacteroidota bacterium]
MKKVFLVPSVLILCITLQAQTKKTTKTVARTKTSATAGAGLKTNTDSISYAFGLSLGQYLKSQGLSSINYAMMNKAVEQSIKGEKTYLDMVQANQVMQSFASAKMTKTSAAEKKKGSEFLAKNKTRKEIVQTPSGLQYEILVKGTGPIPSKSDTVSAHYKGSLLDGKEFDNSYKRGEPLTIPVGAVIPGWTEALTMMPVGSKWKLYIPSTIGYGDVGAGQDIPGGATLVFEVELLGISNKK